MSVIQGVIQGVIRVYYRRLEKRETTLCSVVLHESYYGPRIKTANKMGGIKMEV